jgi:outer membrane protein assembly factor BamC
MEEKSALSSTETNVRWVNGREDPGLNAAMLARLMVFLGDDVDGARRKMAQAQRSPQEPKVAAPVSGDKTALVISESFERAWRRVSVALDSGGFSVEDRDRAAGDFYVRYVDTDTGAKREEPGFFSRLFGAKDAAPAQQFRIHLTPQGDKTQVTILDASGKRDTSPTAARIIDVLGGKI